jgi:phosphatidate cytidylyltransferase
MTMPEIPRNSLIAMAGILALLVVATVTRLILAARNKDKDYTELRQRIQSWWWMVGGLFVVLTLSRGATISFFGFISFLALKEFLSIVPTRQTDRRVIFWAYVAIPIQYYWVYSDWLAMFLIFIPIYLFLFLPLRMVLIGETDGFIRSASLLHWAVMLTVFCISHIAALTTLKPLNDQAGMLGLVLFLLFTTQFNDVCQFIWGKVLGKRKIVPKVSPNKTWEGFLGGLFTVTACSYFVAPLLTPLNATQGLLVGMLISGAGFIGDVVLSSVKRDLRIKDSSHFIPGHGGVLDRMDSLLYTAPLFFHFVNYLCY